MGSGNSSLELKKLCVIAVLPDDDQFSVLAVWAFCHRIGLFWEENFFVKLMVGMKAFSGKLPKLGTMRFNGNDNFPAHQFEKKNQIVFVAP